MLSVDARTEPVGISGAAGSVSNTGFTGMILSEASVVAGFSGILGHAMKSIIPAITANMLATPYFCMTQPLALVKMEVCSKD